MPDQTINVFVSYSHADATLVAPVVRLLRINKSLVFHDTDSITPGKRWRDEIAKALSNSNLVVVFWCHHAAQSDEVTNEWRAAINQAKDLLPLLLDETPLPPELAEFQWIDFRGTVGETHRSIMPWTSDPQVSAPAPAPQSAAPRKSSHLFKYGGLTAAFAAVVVLSLSTLIYHTPTADAFDIVPGIFIGVAAAAMLGTLLFWRRRLKPRVLEEKTEQHPLQAEEQFESEITAMPGQHPDQIEQKIADEIEAEILRRTNPIE